MRKIDLSANYIVWRKKAPYGFIVLKTSPYTRNGEIWMEGTEGELELIDNVTIPRIDERSLRMVGFKEQLKPGFYKLETDTKDIYCEKQFGQWEFKVDLEVVPIENLADLQSLIFKIKSYSNKR